MCVRLCVWVGRCTTIKCTYWHGARSRGGAAGAGALAPKGRSAELSAAPAAVGCRALIAPAGACAGTAQDARHGCQRERGRGCRPAPQARERARDRGARAGGRRECGRRRAAAAAAAAARSSAGTCARRRPAEGAGRDARGSPRRPRRREPGGGAQAPARGARGRSRSARGGADGLGGGGRGEEGRARLGGGDAVGGGRRRGGGTQGAPSPAAPAAPRARAALGPRRAQGRIARRGWGRGRARSDSPERRARCARRRRARRVSTLSPARLRSPRPALRVSLRGYPRGGRRGRTGARLGLEAVGRGPLGGDQGGDLVEALERARLARRAHPRGRQPHGVRDRRHLLERVLTPARPAPASAARGAGRARTGGAGESNATATRDGAQTETGGTPAKSSTRTMPADQRSTAPVEGSPSRTSGERYLPHGA